MKLREMEKKQSISRGDYFGALCLVNFGFILVCGFYLLLAIDIVPALSYLPSILRLLIITLVAGVTIFSCIGFSFTYTYILTARIADLVKSGRMSEYQIIFWVNSFFMLVLGTSLCYFVSIWLLFLFGPFDDMFVLLVILTGLLYLVVLIISLIFLLWRGAAYDVRKGRSVAAVRNSAALTAGAKPRRRPRTLGRLGYLGVLCLVSFGSILVYYLLDFLAHQIEVNTQPRHLSPYIQLLDEILGHGPSLLWSLFLPLALFVLWVIAWLGFPSLYAYMLTLRIADIVKSRRLRKKHLMFWPIIVFTFVFSIFLCQAPAVLFFSKVDLMTGIIFTVLPLSAALIILLVFLFWRGAAYDKRKKASAADALKSGGEKSESAAADRGGTERSDVDNAAAKGQNQEEQN